MNNITITNKRTILIAVVLFLCGLLMMVFIIAALAPNNISSAQPTSLSLSTRLSPPPFPPPSGQPELSAAQKSASTNKTCILKPSSLTKLQGTPQQTEGPYFVDGMPNRSDIRSDPSDGSMQQGIPLHLVIHVYNVDDGSCIPLRGAKVDIWHANSQGVYSDISDQGTIGKKFLRGYQITDNNGNVRFTTIYPGWYQGRAIHIHDKVCTFNESEKTLEWTSQL
jgi:protocatechuate 3,4-dioxygenase beta subunit